MNPTVKPQGRSRATPAREAGSARHSPFLDFRMQRFGSGRSRTRVWCWCPRSLLIPACCTRRTSATCCLVAAGLCQPLWSADTLAELRVNVGERVGQHKADRMVRVIENHFDDAVVTGYEPLVGVMANHAKAGTSWPPRCEATPARS